MICKLIHFNSILFSQFFCAVSPSDNSRTFGLSSVWPLEAPSLKQANGDQRLGPHWRPQSPKSPKSPKVLRLSPQESRYSRTALLIHLWNWDLQRICYTLNSSPKCFWISFQFVNESQAPGVGQQWEWRIQGWLWGVQTLYANPSPCSERYPTSSITSLTASRISSISHRYNSHWHECEL